MTVILEERTRLAVRRLLAEEPEAGGLLPVTAMRVFEHLVGCDFYGIGRYDRTGYRLQRLVFPSMDLGNPQVCDGGVPIGLIHDAAQPEDEREAPYFGQRDFLRLGFATGQGTVTQLYFSRRRAWFTEREVAVLAMVEPAVGRLVRACAAPLPADSLSASERRVLTLVARGASNREVAEELYVTVHTVRKHLENAYRKLGVTNRTAAALHLRVGS